MVNTWSTPTRGRATILLLLLVVSACLVGHAARTPYLLPPGFVQLLPIQTISQAISAVAQPLIEDPLYDHTPRFLTADDGDVCLYQANPWGGPAEPLWRSLGLDPESLAVSWDGLETILVMEENGVQKLQLFLPGRKELLPLTDGPGDDASPTLSQDKSILAFLSNRTGAWKLYTARIGTTPSLDEAPTPLPLWEEVPSIQVSPAQVAIPGDSEERSPNFGPGGLVFLSNLLGTWDLWILEGSDYSTLRRILSDVDAHSPVAWVGDRIFIVRGGMPGLLTPDGLFFQPLDCPVENWWQLPGAPAFISHDGGLSRVTFSTLPEPDFAFFRGKLEGRDSLADLWLGSLEGQAWQIATAVCPGEVAWSPDGKRIAYLRRKPRIGPLPSPEGGYLPDWYELWVAHGDGTDPQPIHLFNPINPPWIPAELQWSPSGDLIYLSVAGSPTHREIWRITPDGENLQEVAWGWDFQVGADSTIGGITRGQTAFVLRPGEDYEQPFDKPAVISQIEFDPTFHWAAALEGASLVLLDWELGRERFVLSLGDDSASANSRFAVSWAPDARALAFAGPTVQGSGVFIYDMATRAATQLSADTIEASLPSWSSDGQYLAYIAADQDSFAAWIGTATSDCHQQRRLLVGEVLPSPIVWRPAAR